MTTTLDRPASELVLLLRVFHRAMLLGAVGPNRRRLLLRQIARLAADAGGVVGPQGPGGRST